MTLFDIRNDESHAWWIARVNRDLDSEPGNPYLSRFGHLCSPRWWVCLDRGELPVEVLSGEVSHSGPRIQEGTGEPEDVVEFVCGGQLIGYDRVGCWDAPIQVGDRVSVTRTVATLETQTGPVTYHIDLRAIWLPALAEQQRHAEPSVAPNCGGIT